MTYISLDSTYRWQTKHYRKSYIVMVMETLFRNEPKLETAQCPPTAESLTVMNSHTMQSGGTVKRNKILTYLQMCEGPC